LRKFSFSVAYILLFLEFLYHQLVIVRNFATKFLHLASKEKGEGEAILRDSFARLLVRSSL